MTDRSPDLWQPPLRWWSQAWRLLLCVILSALVWSQAWSGQWHDRRMLFWLDLGVGLASYALVMLRRRWPVTVAVLTALATAVSGLASGPATLAAVSLATRRRILPLVGVGALGVVAALFYTGTQPVARREAFWLLLSTNLVFTFGMFAFGLYIGSRRELLWTLRDRAERAEAEQALRAATARDQERGRIAREMHDVLAHRISQVSMHAGALAFREDLSAEAMRESAAVIQAKANEALTDLRAVLGVLREQETGLLVEPPQPTYADIPALIEGSREEGMTIVFEDRINGHEVPPAVGRAAYRIIQEGLTNAHKHAPGSTVRVRLAGSPEDGLVMLVRNPLGFSTRPAAPGSGLGLVGLGERASLGGGRLRAQREGGSFVLEGWLPWSAQNS